MLMLHTPRVIMISASCLFHFSASCCSFKIFVMICQLVARDLCSILDELYFVSCGNWREVLIFLWQLLEDW
jgi:hypothetical protein